MKKIEVWYLFSILKMLIYAAYFIRPYRSLFLYVTKYAEFDLVARLHKSISIIRAKPILDRVWSERNREFSRGVSLSLAWHFLISEREESSPSRDAEGGPFLEAWCVGLYNKRIAGERAEERGGRGDGFKHTYTPVSRNTDTRRLCYARSAAAYRYYSGLNNIMSRGKREDLCNWTRERARSIGSAEETLLPLSIPSRILSPTAAFLLIVIYILRW